MYKIILLLFLILLSYSCIHDNKKNDIQSLVKKWQGREIIFPKDQIIFETTAGDTINMMEKDKPYKILMYIDSIGCISCKFKLSKWKKFIEEINSASKSNVLFYFFIHTNNIEEFKYILKRDNFTYPVCLDVNNCIDKLNNFPNKIAFQTFLLDNKNKVKIIGNPIDNINVKELYLQELSIINKDTCITTNTIIKTDKLEYELGDIEAGSTKKQDIYIHNIGTNQFNIKGVTTSCDCTDAIYNWETIPSGKSRIITVIYKADKIGDFFRTVTIYGNIPEKSFTFNLVGSVKNENKQKVHALTEKQENSF